MTVFRPWGVQHLVPLALIAAMSLLILRVREKRARFLPALAILAYVTTAYYERFSLAGWGALPEALPLDLCDLVVLICLWALVFPSQPAFELAYFWGLAGALQALLQPDISDNLGFPNWYYLEYFLGHGLIFAAVFFLMGAYRFAPRPGSWWRAVLLLNVYVVVVGLVDMISGWNYGYLCAKPRSATLLDYMGRWPIYLVSLEVLAALNFWLLWIPWRPIRKGEGTGERILDATGESAQYVKE